jgi:hypothetical protein
MDNHMYSVKDKDLVKSMVEKAKAQDYYDDENDK